MNKYQEVQKEGFIKRIQIPCTNLTHKQIDEIDKIISSIEHKVAIEFVEQYDEMIIQSLYDFYKNKCNELIIIDETKFKQFLTRFIPIYLKEKELGVV